MSKSTKKPTNNAPKRRGRPPKKTQASAKKPVTSKKTTNKKKGTAVQKEPRTYTSTVPNLEQLRQRADRLGVDISNYGRARKDINNFLNAVEAAVANMGNTATKPKTTATKPKTTATAKRAPVRKIVTVPKASKAAAGTTTTTPAPKKRGRPRKVTTDDVVVSSTPKRGRGRPTINLADFKVEIESKYPNLISKLGVDPDTLIAEEFGLSRERVRQFRKKLGIETRARRQPKVTDAQVLKAYKKCATTKDICDELDISYVTLANRIRKLRAEGHDLPKKQSPKTNKSRNSCVINGKEISVEKFVAAWNACKGPTATAGRLRIPDGGPVPVGMRVSQMASRLRAQGYDLKKIRWWEEMSPKKRSALGKARGESIRKARAAKRDSFVALWNASKTIKEVSEQTGLDEAALRKKAANIRNKYGTEMTYL
jgi:transposase